MLFYGIESSELDSEPCTTRLDLRSPCKIDSYVAINQSRFAGFPRLSVTRLHDEIDCRARRLQGTRAASELSPRMAAMLDIISKSTDSIG